jgi:hypothetical protein
MLLKGDSHKAVEQVCLAGTIARYRFYPGLPYTPTAQANRGAIAISAQASASFAPWAMQELASVADIGQSRWAVPNGNGAVNGLSAFRKHLAKAAVPVPRHQAEFASSAHDPIAIVQAKPADFPIGRPNPNCPSSGILGPLAA